MPGLSPKNRRDLHSDWVTKAVSKFICHGCKTTISWKDTTVRCGKSGQITTCNKCGTELHKESLEYTNASFICCSVAGCDQARFENEPGWRTNGKSAALKAARKRQKGVSIKMVECPNHR